MKINELLPEQRPYERALLFGVEKLTDCELIAILLRSGTKGKSSVELANEVLSIDKGRSGLLNFSRLSYEDLIKIKGLGKVKALELSCSIELSKRLSASRIEKNIRIEGPDDFESLFFEELRHLDHEVVYLVLLDQAQRYIKKERISEGSFDSCAVSPREIIKSALSCNAGKIALVHNHPSGNPDPSSQDVAFSKVLRDAAELMGIELIDSLIIGVNGYVSLSQKGLL